MATLAAEGLITVTRGKRAVVAASDSGGEMTA
jgi:DNA-binding FadR family transcriptional regulator